MDLFAKARRVSEEKGIRYVIWIAIQLIYYVLRLTYAGSKPARTFTFLGNTYNYFYHFYNLTMLNERAVEIPIIWEFVKKHPSPNILEIGNVLSHYFPVKHDILDKYEKAEGVINQDVLNFQPSKKYDLIVSISTLEHPGWDEHIYSGNLETRDPAKVLRVIEHLKSLLTPEGKIIATIPVGFNAEFDKLLKSGELRFTEQYFMKRISSNNRWMEVDWDDIRDVKHDSPYPYANGLVIAIIKKN